MFARVLAALALLTLAGAAGPATSSAGWSRLADPPFLRSGSVRVWTGQELLVWGGYEPDGTFRADGAAYDVGLRRWRALPPAPLRGRADSAGVWTGRTLLVWGGWAGHRAFADGAAYDPLSHRWRRLPHAPLDARIPAAWSGPEPSSSSGATHPVFALRGTARPTTRGSTGGVASRAHRSR